MEQGVVCKYIGSKYGLETKYTDKFGSAPVFLNIKGFSRNLNLKSVWSNLAFPFKILFAYVKTWKIINDFNPNVVVGTGGYSSGLPLLAAIHKGIKTVIQEQNSFPGITTRHLSSRVDKICIAYEDAASHLKKKILSLQETLFGRTFK